MKKVVALLLFVFFISPAMLQAESDPAYLNPVKICSEKLCIIKDLLPSFLKSRQALTQSIKLNLRVEDDVVPLSAQFDEIARSQKQVKMNI